eukprot:TRINITY_DN31281_c0_g1_i1.p1 TRINITY_DN31281_c0_g1~~TRINITY_DN31281_c0_g1_i1.p1  ORF type:complete len:148 (+),score=14.70 TRINITY_DN31281_c0_g1_i1:156-599(+)
MNETTSPLQPPYQLVLVAAYYASSRDKINSNVTQKKIRKRGTKEQQGKAVVENRSVSMKSFEMEKLQEAIIHLHTTESGMDISLMGLYISNLIRTGFLEVNKANRSKRQLYNLNMSLVSLSLLHTFCQNLTINCRDNSMGALEAVGC